MPPVTKHARRASTAWTGNDRFTQATAPTNTTTPEQHERATGMLRRLSLGGAMARVSSVLGCAPILASSSLPPSFLSRCSRRSRSSTRTRSQARKSSGARHRRRSPRRRPRARPAARTRWARARSGRRGRRPRWASASSRGTSTASIEWHRVLSSQRASQPGPCFALHCEPLFISACAYVSFRLFFVRAGRENPSLRFRKSSRSAGT